MTGRLAARLVQLRLASGLILFAWLICHYTNHALGLSGLRAMMDGSVWLLRPWQTLPGLILLYGALLAHFCLAIWSLMRRRTWRRLRAYEVVQIIMGLAIPPLVALHVIGVRGLFQMYGFPASYPYVLLALSHFSPMDGLIQSVVLVVAWLHGCIGMHAWLRLKPWYGRVALLLYTFAIVLPLLAMLGFGQGGREAVRLWQTDPDFAAWLKDGRLPTAEMGAWGYMLRDSFYAFLVALAAGLLGIRVAWPLLARGLGHVVLSYPMNQKVRVQPGTMTVLEASRSAGIAHASICGGRGRCSTCRVRLGPGAEHLPPPDADELRVLKRVGASPGVRLACQIRPATDLVVVPLLPPHAGPVQAFGRPDYAHGAEREIAVLFADLRNFTRFAELRLPYDVVFIINTYSEKMGAAVEAAGGRVDKFIGDGVMALFGLDGNPQRGAMQAVAAARGMALALAEMNETLRHDLPEPLRMGIGIHFGPAIVGEMGYGHATTLTAIGDTVNTASRLETATKEFGAQLVVSHELAALAGLNTTPHRDAEIEVRGRAQKMKIVVVDDAGALPA